MLLSEALRTTGSVRAFTDEPVDDALLFDLIDTARFAPSGGNRQGWRIVVVRDQTIRRRLGAMMQTVWDDYVAAGSSGSTPFNVISSPTDTVAAAAASPVVPNPLLDQIAHVPVMLVIAADLNRIAMMDKDLDRPAITGGGSIYPFCWNLLLAARSRGLGGVLTTFLARAEREARPVLGLPADFALAGTIFLGHPVHQPTKLRRDPVETFTTIDRFDGPAFDG